MRVRIPAVTLHTRIHERIHDIPCPAEYICDMTVCELDDLLMKGIISKQDSIVRRLDTLIQIFAEYNRDPYINLDATLSVLRWQRQICRSFFSKQ